MGFLLWGVLFAWSILIDSVTNNGLTSIMLSISDSFMTLVFVSIVSEPNSFPISLFRDRIFPTSSTAVNGAICFTICMSPPLSWAPMFVLFLFIFFTPEPKKIWTGTKDCLWSMPKEHTEPGLLLHWSGVRCVTCTVMILRLGFSTNTVCQSKNGVIWWSGSLMSGGDVTCNWEFTMWDWCALATALYNTSTAISAMAPSGSIYTGSGTNCPLAWHHIIRTIIHHHHVKTNTVIQLWTRFICKLGCRCEITLDVVGGDEPAPARGIQLLHTTAWVPTRCIGRLLCAV